MGQANDRQMPQLGSVKPPAAWTHCGYDQACPQGGSMALL